MAQAWYELRLDGVVDDAQLGLLEGMSARVVDGSTFLRGVLPNQAALLRIIGRAERSGLELLGLRRLDPVLLAPW
ncbi:MAG: hypothetical protein ACTHN8_08600 [Angustibacter sp.]